MGRRATEERALRCARAPQHNHAKSALHSLRRVLRGWSAHTARSEKRMGYAPLDLNSMSATFCTPCSRPVAVLMRSSPGQRRGEECVPRWTTNNHSNSALRATRRACSVGSRPILHPAKARGMRASNLNAVSTTLRTPCCQHVAVVARSSPDRRRWKERAPHWPTTQPRQVRTAQRAVSPWAVGRYFTRQRGRGPRGTES